MALEEKVAIWAKVNYPQLIGNEELIMKLYRRKVLGETTAVKEPAKYVSTYPYRKVSALELNKPAGIYFTKVEIIKETKVQVCAVCGRKNCNDPSHSGKKDLYVLKMYGGDDSGDITVVILIDNPQMYADILQAEEFLFFGKLTQHEKFGKDFIVNNSDNIVILDKELNEAFNDFVNFMELYGGAGGVDIDKFNSFINLKGEKLGNLLKRIAFQNVGGKIIW